jgi:tellurite resistance protein TerC
MAWPLWLAFLSFVAALLALDLGVLNRRPHVISAREAVAWTGGWVALALVFDVVVYWLYAQGLGATSRSGAQAAAEFLTGYVVEESLSLDNIFVITLVLGYFRVPAAYQHRVLFWGIVGALLLRGVMIAAGLALIERFEWLTYVFGLILFVTAWKMLFSNEDEDVDFSGNPLIRLVRRALPLTTEYHGQRFFVRQGGKVVATPLFLTLVLVEGTDLVFAVDSIPAVFSVTTDPFLVFTSNIFAILGLRSLFFAVAAVLSRFRYLKLSLVFLLAFIGAKMTASHYVELRSSVTLSVVAGILGVGALASLLVEPTGAATRVPARRYRSGFVALSSGTIAAVVVGLLLLPEAVLWLPAAGAVATCGQFWIARSLVRRAYRALPPPAAQASLPEEPHGRLD